MKWRVLLPCLLLVLLATSGCCWAAPTIVSYCISHRVSMMDTGPTWERQVGVIVTDPGGADNIAGLTIVDPTGASHQEVVSRCVQGDGSLRIGLTWSEGCEPALPEGVGYTLTVYAQEAIPPGSGASATVVTMPVGHFPQPPPDITYPAGGSVIRDGYPELAWVPLASLTCEDHPPVAMQGVCIKDENWNTIWQRCGIPPGEASIPYGAGAATRPPALTPGRVYHVGLAELTSFAPLGDGLGTHDEVTQRTQTFTVTGPSSGAETVVELWRGGGYSAQMGGLSVNPTDGSAWVADSGNKQVVHFAADGAELWRSAPAPSPEGGPTAVSVDPEDGSCWVAEAGSYDAPGSRYLSYVTHLAADGAEVWRGAGFSLPASVSVDPADGSCWVADSFGSRLVHLSATGGQLAATGPGYYLAYAVSADPADGSAWALYQGGYDLVVHLSASGQALWYGGHADSPHWQMGAPPTAVAVDPQDGSGWIADSAERCVLHLGATGEELWRSTPYDRYRAAAVAVDSGDGSCWVADPGYGQVVHLSPSGEELWRSLPGYQGGTYRPINIAVNPVDGSCWFTENNDVVHLGLHELSMAAHADPSVVSSGATTSLTASYLDSLGSPIQAWAWDDGGAGGAFSPSATVQSPTYTAPVNDTGSALSVTLTVTATAGGPLPLLRSASTTLTVNPPSAGWTPAGSGVSVSLGDCQVIFDTVLQGGVTAASSLPTPPGAPPTGFTVVGDYYDITTTAQTSGTIAVSLHYDDTGLTQESSLRLLHWNDVTQHWDDITTGLDTDGNVLEGHCDGLGFFVIALPLPRFIQSVSVDRAANRNWDGSVGWYGIDVGVSVSDPDGIDRIASVTVTDPLGQAHSIPLGSQDGPTSAYYWSSVWGASAPPAGTYTVTVVDLQGASDSASGVTSEIPTDLPTIAAPEANYGVLSGLPTFSWSAPSGDDGFSLGVMDAGSGSSVWSPPGPVTSPLTYGGPDLVPGRPYQWFVYYHLPDGVQADPRVTCHFRPTATGRFTVATGSWPVPIQGTILFNRGSAPDYFMSGESSQVTPTHLPAGASLSPDGQRAAYSDGTAIHVCDANGGNDVLLPVSLPGACAPLWSPDGKRIAFKAPTAENPTNHDPAAGCDGQGDIFVIDADGSNLQQITHSPGPNRPRGWSPDGRYLLWEWEPCAGLSGACTIWKGLADGTEAHPITGPGLPLEGAQADSSAWSPDGSRILVHWTACCAPQNEATGFLGTVTPEGTDARPVLQYTAPGGSGWWLRPYGGVWSPDGAQVAFTSAMQMLPADSTTRGDAELYLIGKDGSGLTRLSYDLGETRATAWIGPNTLPGTNVLVSICDTTLTFPHVSQAGLTTAVVMESAPNPAPAGFQLLGPGYELKTTAQVDVPIAVQFRYDDAGLAPADESHLRLLERQGGQWVDVTTALHTDAKTIEGSCASLGQFVLAFQTAGAVIHLQDSAGNPLAGGKAQYYSSGWHDLGVTSADGTVRADLPPASYTFSMDYAFGRVQKTQDVATDSDVVFRTQAVVVKLQDGTGRPLSGGKAQYYAGGWHDIGLTGADGAISTNLLPATYTFSMDYASGRVQKAQDITSDPVVAFQAAGVVVHFQDSAGNPLAGGKAQYYSTGWHDIGVTGADGTVRAELPPATYTFSMDYAHGRVQQAQDVSTTPIVAFQTEHVVVELLNSTGSPVAGGVAQYYSGGWYDLGATGAGGTAGGELLPASYTFGMTYASGRQQKAQNIATDPLVVFQTPGVVVLFQDSAGHPLAGGKAQYYSGGWHDMGTTGADGAVAMDLTPATYTFSLDYAFGRIQKAQNIVANPTVVFQTQRAVVQLQDSLGSPLANGKAQYYAGGWHDLGTTGPDGLASLELLPATYTFSMDYAFGRVQKAQDIASGPTVLFQTQRVTAQLMSLAGVGLVGAKAQYYASSWHDIGLTGADGTVSVELLPNSYTFSMDYAFGRSQKAQNVAAGGDVTFQTGQAHSVSATCTQYYAGAWRAFTNDMELLPATYTFRFSDGTASTQAAITAAGVMNLH